MGKDAVVLAVLKIAIYPSIKAHDDVINTASMKYQNDDEPQNPKENIGDQWDCWDAKNSGM